MKTCSKCDVEKAFGEFHKSNSTKDGFHIWCKSCRKAYQGINASRKAEYDKRYRETITEDRHEKRRARMREYQKEYTKLNPDKNAAHVSKRRAQEIRATPKWADQEAILAFYKQAADLTKSTGEKYEVDHIVPLRSKLVCGLHCEQNMAVLKKIDNVSKGNRHWPNMP